MRKQSRFARYFLTGGLLLGLLCLAFWVRIQGVDRLPAAQFTSNDAYHYYWQANIIAEQGTLPARDMHRWLPLGRDNTQQLPLYAYTIAYTHKVFPWFSIYHIQIYLPVLSFIVGLGALFVFLTRTYGILFAAIVGLLLATLPGSIERSAAGFGDRYAWCWMLGVLAVTSYLWKEQIAPGHRRWLATALAGFTVFLGGLSWEAFGVFVLVIVVTELWKFCSTDTEQHLKEYLLWMLMFVPWLYLISPAYRSGYGYTTHLFALTIAPPLSVFAMRGIRAVLLKHIDTLRPHARKLAVGLTLLAITAGGSYIFFQYSIFETTAFILFENALMKNIEELKNPTLKYWVARYSSVFIFSSFGLIVTCLNLWKWKSLPLAGALLLFVGTTFFRDFVNEWTSPKNCNTLFFISLGLTLPSLGSLAYLQRDPRKNEWTTLAMLTWFCLWVGLSRGSKRYDFFIGVPIAFFTATFIQFITETFSESIQQNRKHLLKTSLTIFILIALMFFPVFGTYTKNTIYAATEMRKIAPKYIKTACHWIKNELPKNAVVAADWSYGTRLNVFGGVKTIIDPDHYLPHWLALYSQYVSHTTSEREFLEFLKTHEATHLMVTRRDFVTNPFLRQTDRDTLVPVYPLENFSKAHVKIWEIHYPPDIQTDPKYLKTGFPEIDKDLHLQ